MNTGDILEGIYSEGDLAEQVRSLPKEEKEKLDFATKQFLSYEERVAVCENAVLEWGIYKFTCKPFTLGLFKDLYQAVAPAFFGKTSESEIFAKCAGLILKGETPGAVSYLRTGFVEDILSENGTDIEKYHKAEEIMAGVSFFSIHYWRFGEKLKAKTSVVKEVKSGRTKSPKVKSS